MEKKYNTKVYSKKNSGSSIQKTSRNVLLNAICRNDRAKTNTLLDQASDVSEDSHCDLKPSAILPMQIVEVEITHVDSPSCFYVQKLVEYGKLGIIFDEINAIGRTLDQPPNPSLVVAGSCFLGQFSRDGNFYRAKIIQKQPNGNYHVKYVDYGNSESINISRLRVCPSKYNFDAIPPYEIRCSLWGIEQNTEGDWTDQATNLLIELITERKLKMCILSICPIKDIVDANLCQVTLMRPAIIENYVPLSLAEVLVYFGHAKFLQKVSSEGRDPPGLVTYNLPDVPLNCNPIDVKIMHVESPSHFYLQFLSSSKLISAEMSKIQTFYHTPEIATDSDWNIFVPKVGMICCVKSPQSHLWHRAVVEDENGPSEITVKLVDTGATHVVSFKELKKIDKSFLSLPFQAIRCKLFDAIPLATQWTEDATTNFQNIVNKKKTQAIFKNRENDTFGVSLRIEDGSEDVSQIMFDNDCCSLERSNSRVRNGQYLSTVLDLLNVTGLEDGTFATSRRSVLLAGRKGREQVLERRREQGILKEMFSKVDYADQSVRHFVAYLGITTLNAIHVRFHSQQQRYLQILNDLEQIPLNSKRMSYFPKLGEVACTYLKDKKLKARVKILRADSESVVGYLLDVGLVDTFPISSIFPLNNEKLINIPPQSSIVALSDVHPTCGVAEWSKTAIEFARDVLSSACDLFIIRKGKVYKDPSLHNLKVLPVEMGWIHKSSCPFEEDKEFATSFNEIIVDRGLALPIRSMESRIPQPNLIRPSKPRKSSSEDLAAGDSLEVSCDDVAIMGRGKSFSSLDSPPVQSNLSKFLFGHSLSESLDDESQPEASRSKFSWKAPPPIEGKAFIAKVTNVLMDASIALYPISAEAKLTEMETVSAFEFRDPEPKECDLLWTVGDAVAARYFQDSKWYRATILEQKDDKAHVEFVDYGNTDTVALKDIRTKILFQNTPMQCYKCTLDGVEPTSPSGWTVEQLDFLHRLIVDKTCHVKLTEDYKADVKPKISLELYDTKTNVKNILVEMRICKEIKKVSPKPHKVATPTHSLSSDVIEDDDLSSQNEEYYSQKSSLDGECTYIDFSSLSNVLPRFPCPARGSTVPINVCSISEDDPFVIHISLPMSSEDSLDQSQDEFYEELHSLHEAYKEMQNYIQENIHSCRFLTDLTRGMLCLAFFTDSNIWHRGLVLDVDESEFQVQILFVDYGHKDWIDKKLIREAPNPDCYMVPPYCTQVKIHGIKPSANIPQGPEIMNEMLSVLFHKKENFLATFMSTEDDVPEIRLFVREITGDVPLSQKHFDNPKFFSFKK